MPYPRPYVFKSYYLFVLSLLGFGAGGVLGLEANLKVCIMTMKLRVSLFTYCSYTIIK